MRIVRSSFAARQYCLQRKTRRLKFITSSYLSTRRGGQQTPAAGGSKWYRADYEVPLCIRTVVVASVKIKVKMRFFRLLCSQVNTVRAAYRESG